MHAPALSPEEAGRQALAEYDTNQDSFLDAKELERCPALKASLQAIDKNHDGRLTAEEITERLASVQATNTGLLGITGRVTLDGRSLPGATVTLIPEKFMGTNAKPASGVADETGALEFRVEGGQIPGVHPGFYRIEVSKKDAAGKELVPARYNSATILGREVAPDPRKTSSIVLDLSAD